MNSGGSKESTAAESGGQMWIRRLWPLTSLGSKARTGTAARIIKRTQIPKLPSR